VGGNGDTGIWVTAWVKVGNGALVGRVVEVDWVVALGRVVATGAEVGVLVTGAGAVGADGLVAIAVMTTAIGVFGGKVVGEAVHAVRKRKLINIKSERRTSALDPGG
jgi:hypothetical protein